MFSLFLEEWIATSDDGDLRLIADILREADHRFVFTYRPFVERYLEKAKQVSPEVLKRAISSLFGSAIGGIRSGNLGDPMPRDLEMKKVCEEILGSLHRFSPAFELYGLGFDHSDKDDARYEAVTLEDVKRVAAKILAEDKFVISVVKPGK